MARRKGNKIAAQGVKEIATALEKLPGKGMVVVQTRAINKVLPGARVDGSKLVRQVLKLRQKDVRPKFTITRATHRRPYGYVRISSHPVPLSRYPFWPKNPPRQKGVPVKNRKNTSIHILQRGQRKTVHSGFVARMKSGHVGVFMREGDKRAMKSGNYQGEVKQPIRELHGPGPGPYFRRNVMQRRFGRRVIKRLHKSLNHELNYYIRQQFRRMAKAGLTL